MNTSTPQNHPSAAKKIVVIGGSGLIGKQLVRLLRERGHQVVPASPSVGVNAVTGEGLTAALAGAEIVVDVSNSPSFEDGPVREFFEKSTRNLVATETAAGVRHHVALSVVGTDRLPESGYFRAKLVQENLIKSSPVPYTIVRATQFFEFVQSIAYAATEGQTVRVPSALMQPIAAADVAAALADLALAPPVNGIVALAGPESIRQDEFVRRFLSATNDPRTVTVDPNARYFGLKIDDRSLTPDAPPRTGATRFENWLSRTSVPKPTAPVA
ncbi:MAG TPA: SDR family oxidoreductase [Opitutaceae bacterium]